MEQAFWRESSIECCFSRSQTTKNLTSVAAATSSGGEREKIWTEINLSVNSLHKTGQKCVETLLRAHRDSVWLLCFICSAHKTPPLE